MEERATAQNDYVQHKKLYILENIASEYQAGREYTGKIQELIQQIETQRYRVAVIGEFKRGKSSMINALLGAEVLPTDILPMTAAVNRIVYGNKKEIVIHYKDGRSESAEIGDLIAYATKYDEEKALRAEKVKEIVVTYPSVFCKNYIEIYDTPGLNDDEPMTETTLNILKEVDAAIVVVSAVMPLSMTEQNLIIKLLECREIHNIVFVITFIDAVSSRKSEQDKVIHFMKSRISETVLQRALSLHEDDLKFQEKARRILEHPETFAVSSLLALKGFLQDDEEILEKSRFPEFKYSLLEVLTAGQSLETEYRVSNAIKEVSEEIQNWYGAEEKSLEEEVMLNESSYQKCITYIKTIEKELEKLFVETDASLEISGLNAIEGAQKPVLADNLRKIFIKALSSLRVGVSEKEIKQAISSAADGGLAEMQSVVNSLYQNTIKQLKQNSQKFELLRQEGFIRVIETAWEMQIPSVKGDWEEKNIPKFGWNGELYPPTLNLLREDVMPFINRRIWDSLEAFGMKCNEYVAGWRKGLIQQNIADGQNAVMLQKQYEEKKSALQMKKEIKRQQFNRHKEQLQQLMSGQMD